MKTASNSSKTTNPSEIERYLLKLGFDHREAKIYVHLASMGIQPASSIAKACQFDRVTTYKHLKKMAKMSFIKTYMQNGVQQFGVDDFENLQRHLTEKQETVQELLSSFPTIAHLLKNRNESENFIPKLQLFEGKSGMKGLFRDITFTVKKKS